jgi:ubiquinone/menaquinone biosynthesis C-methylase UbiE
MKIRESGMPDETFWESFFDTGEIFSKLKLDDTTSDVAEFGSGYGTFTLPAAKVIKGNIFAFDIDSAMIDRLKQRSEQDNSSNIKILNKDFIKDGTGLKNNSIDYVMMFNILHAANPEILLNEAYRILKQQGKLGVIHWIHSADTPRGPSMNIRPTPEQCSYWIESAKFKIVNKEISLPPYHYGILCTKI